MSELDKIRENINSIDEQMAQLFQERMEMSRQVAAFKKDRGLSIRDAERERELIDRDRRFIKDPAVDAYYVQFLRSILDLSCAYQSRILNGMKVAYSGVEGAYGYIAARRMFPEAQLIAYPDFAAAHRAVEQGEADSAVLPLENSYAGEVGAVMDLLFSGELYINQVLDLEIDHSLLGVEGAAPDTVRTVVSHPQALAQCQPYLRRQGWIQTTAVNTAVAARTVAAGERREVAVIAARETAELYGLQVLENDINEQKSNTTRFAVFSPAACEIKPSDNHFVLLFSCKNQPGALGDAISVISRHDYNLKCLKSHPTGVENWAYYFYAEGEGNLGTEAGQTMRRELERVCNSVRVLGSFSGERMLNRTDA